MNPLVSNLSKDQLEAVVDFLVARVAGSADGVFEPLPYCFDMTSPPQDLAEQAAASLRRNGLVVIRNYAEPAVADNLARRFFDFFETIRGKVHDRATAEEKNYIIQDPRAPKYKDYVELAKQGKAVVNVRPPPDDGMVDIFNVDQVLSGTDNDYAGIRSDFLLDVLHKAGDVRYERRNTNIYYNESIADTRVFHADSFTPQVKAFVYLTDVEEDGDGPHYYALGTHDAVAARQLNVDINNLLGIERFTNACFFDKTRVVKLLGRRGTLIMSYQRGFHRGGPQLPGRRRLVLVQNFMQA